MKLFDDAARLVELAERIRSHQQLEDNHARLAKAADRLRQSVDMIAKATAFLDLVEPDRRTAFEVGKAVVALQQARAVVDTAKDQRDLAAIDDAAVESERVAARFEVDAQRAWEEYRRRHVPTGRTMLLQALAVVPELRSTAAKLRADYRTIEQSAAGTYPSSPEDFEAFEALVEQAEVEWSKLELEDEEVSRFLIAAASPSGARLSSLTPPVKQWLEHQGLLDVFVVQVEADGC